MSTFEIGDKVRVLGNYKGNEGKIGTIVDNDGTNVLPFTVKFIGGGEERVLSANELELVAKKEKATIKVKKQKPYKFALQYELEEDPTEYFHELKDVRKRIVELAEKRDLKRDKVYLHTISRTQKVEIGVSVHIGRGARA